MASHTLIIILLALGTAGGAAAAFYFYVRRRRTLERIGAARAEIAVLTSDTRWLEEIIATQNQLAGATSDLGGFMQMVAERLLQLTPATGSAVEILEGDDMVYRAGAGALVPQVGLRLKATASLSGRCVATGSILYCEDTETDPRVERAVSRHVGARSMVVAPLLQEQGGIGALKVMSGRPAAFGERDLRTLELMGGLISAAIAMRVQHETRERLLSEVHASADALFHEKERAHVTLRSIGDAVITTDTDGRVEYLNPAAEQLTGWPDASARGKPVHAVFPLLDSRTSGAVALPQVIAGDRLVLGDDTILRRQDGRECAIEVTMAPIRDQNQVARGFVLISRDVSAARTLSRRIAHEARHDPLTGVANRREFDERLHQALEGLAQRRRAFSLLFIDLDHFKAVNDSAGHLAGDRLLQEVAALLQSGLRESDTLARLGGDEFALLLEGCLLPPARIIAEQLRGAVDAFCLEWQGHSFRVGASIGVVHVHSGYGSIADVLSAADSACYKAKQNGRNQVYVSPDVRDDPSAYPEIG